MKKFTLELEYFPKGIEDKVGELTRGLFSAAPLTSQAALGIISSRGFDGLVKVGGISIRHNNAEIARLVWENTGPAATGG